MSYYDYERELMGRFTNLRMELLSRPLMLGGASSISGGAGGPVGGFIGYLPQTRVAYDESEVAASGTPFSGASLLDNLNHIRYRLGVLEAGGIPSSGTTSSGISAIEIKEDGVTEGNATTINFTGNVDVTFSTPTATVNIPTPSISFDNLTDVVIYSPPYAEEIIFWDGSQWSNGRPYISLGRAVDLGITATNQLWDSDVRNPVDKQTLQYYGDKWINYDFPIFTRVVIGDMSPEYPYTATDYIDITTSGYRMYGAATTFEELSVELTPGRLGALTKPDWDSTNLGFLFPQNDATEIVYITAQLPHSYKEGSTIYPQVRVQQAANDQAIFKIDYKWYNLGDAVPSGWVTYTMNTYEKTYTSGTMSQMLRGASGISGSGKQMGSLLKIKLYRDDNGYIGDMLCDEFDIAYEMDSIGSNTKTVK